MCGIVGYIGEENAIDVVIQGLCSITSRGYHASGITFVRDGVFVCHKMLKGKKLPPTLLLDQQSELKEHATACIGHTRWPSHGDNLIKNAHPHFDCSRRVAVVHNGTITNGDKLRGELVERGHEFATHVDSEVVAHLIEDVLKQDISFIEACKSALRMLQGSYSFLFMDREDPSVIVAARFGQPLVLGRSDRGFILGSDETAICHQSRQHYRFVDGDVVVVRADRTDVDDRITQPVTVHPDEVDREGYDHHMIKEIMQQPDVCFAAMNKGTRLNFERGMPRLGGFIGREEQLARIDHVVLVACGTAYHAALVASKWFRDLAGMPRINVFIASEAKLHHLDPERTAVIVISQSGETKDTYMAVEEARGRGILTIGVVNRVGTSIAHDTTCGSFCNAGLESSVASTKVFTSQLTVLFLMALFFARQRGAAKHQGNELMRELLKMPDVLRDVLSEKSIARIRDVAVAQLAHKRFVAFMGRGLHWPIALEGALKFKEITYTAAEGYAAGELKHGSLALLDIDTPVVACISGDETMEYAAVNVSEVAVTGAPVVAVVDESAVEHVRAVLIDDRHTIIVMPRVHSLLQPMVSVLPMQLLAYYAAYEMEREIDTPRHLSKALTIV